MAAFRAAGIDRVHFGIESGSAVVLKIVNKGESSEDHAKGSLKTAWQDFPVHFGRVEVHGLAHDAGQPVDYDDLAGCQRNKKGALFRVEDQFWKAEEAVIGLHRLAAQPESDCASGQGCDNDHRKGVLDFCLNNRFIRFQL